MAEYTVKWVIQTSGETPLEGAKEAWDILKNNLAEANTLDVFNDEGEFIYSYDME